MDKKVFSFGQNVFSKGKNILSMDKTICLWICISFCPCRRTGSKIHALSFCVHKIFCTLGRNNLSRDKIFCQWTDIYPLVKTFSASTKHFVSGQIILCKGQNILSQGQNIFCMKRIGHKYFSLWWLSRGNWRSFFKTPIWIWEFSNLGIAPSLFPWT